MTERVRTEMMRPLGESDRRCAQLRDGAVMQRDLPALALLMIDAYRGTIDDEGESLEDAEGVVESLFNGAFGTFDGVASTVVREANSIVAATLVTHHLGFPLIAFTMTHPSAARRGHARRGLHHAFGVMSRARHQEVRLVVTTGNVPAMTLYQREGFVSLSSDSAPTTE